MAGTAAKSPGIVVPHKTRWHQQAGAWLVYLGIRLLAATIRFRWSDRSEFAPGKHHGPSIYCCWHNRLPLSLFVYAHHAKKYRKTRRLVALVSASRDGGFLSGILKCFGVQPVRGSSSRRGPQALRELTTWTRRGYDIAITPDGPRGPCYQVHDGVISLAQLTGLPVVAASYQLGWKIRLRSWDRLQLPLPFSTCEVVVAKSFLVSRRASVAEREQFRRQLENTLKEISGD